ncbi:conserved hypothetical protein [Ricinus communis]|uniref:Uncharacterized protein n=1 Tax=Ricinus communis TaxID=3988 RepID=B9RPX4_RICCO|nr:conserved hypothetical protein [Ricinus communis]
MKQLKKVKLIKGKGSASLSSALLAPPFSLKQNESLKDSTTTSDLSLGIPNQVVDQSLVLRSPPSTPSIKNHP